jgi:hypothetical protein
LGERFVGVHVLDEAHREMLNIHPVERILAVLAAAVIRTRVPVFQAHTASVGTARLALPHVATPTP